VPRQVRWVIVNLAIAVGVAAVALFALIVGDDEEASGIADALAASAFGAIYFLPWYLPGVILHLVLLAVLRDRWKPRAVSVLFAPVAPFLLWGLLLEDPQPRPVAVLVGGSLAYGLLARLPQASAAPVLAASALIVGLATLIYSFSFGVLLLVPALAVLWLLRNRAPVARHS
jgi:hypothetical protein